MIKYLNYSITPYYPTIIIILNLVWIELQIATMSVCPFLALDQVTGDLLMKQCRRKHSTRYMCAMCMKCALVAVSLMNHARAVSINSHPHVVRE